MHTELALRHCLFRLRTVLGRLMLSAIVHYALAELHSSPFLTQPRSSACKMESNSLLCQCSEDAIQGKTDFNDNMEISIREIAPEGTSIDGT